MKEVKKLVGFGPRGAEIGFDRLCRGLKSNSLHPGTTKTRLNPSKQKNNIQNKNSNTEAAIKVVEAYRARLGNPKVIVDYSTHCIAKKSFRGDSCVLEVVWTPESLDLKRVFDATVAEIGGEKQSGAPPPQQVERDLKKLIVDLKRRLNIRTRT